MSGPADQRQQAPMRERTLSEKVQYVSDRLAELSADPVAHGGALFGLSCALHQVAAEAEAAEAKLAEAEGLLHDLRHHVGQPFSVQLASSAIEEQVDAFLAREVWPVLGERTS